MSTGFRILTERMRWEIDQGLIVVAETPDDLVEFLLPRREFESDFGVRSGHLAWARANLDRIEDFCRRFYERRSRKP